MKKNRFYYSFDQECIALNLGEWDETMSRIEAVRENYVLTPNGYRKYTQWCSTPGSKCNWDDAKLVFETDDDPKIKITYRKTSQLQALEDENEKLRKQLALTEKALGLACEMLCGLTVWDKLEFDKAIKDNCDYFKQQAKKEIQ